MILRPDFRKSHLTRLHMPGYFLFPPLNLDSSISFSFLCIVIKQTWLHKRSECVYGYFVY